MSAAAGMRGCLTVHLTDVRDVCASLSCLCRAAGQLVHFTAASTFDGVDHRVLLCSMCTVLTDPSAMMYAEAFKWVLEDDPLRWLRVQIIR